MATKYIAQTPSLAGRLAIVTGASQGLGLQTAKTLAAMGADVVLAVRDASPDKAVALINREMKPFFLQHSRELHQPTVKVMPLDLASFASVRRFVEDLRRKFPARAPSMLVNNAGLMLKERAVTVDGNEQLLQVNYLSPVLLSLLMARDIVAPALALTTAADAKTTPVALPHDLRIVNLSTGFHAKGKLNFDDRLQTTEGYENMKAYCQAKLALTTFTNFLQRAADVPSVSAKDPSLAFLHELKKGGSLDLRAISLDPGYIRTQLVRPTHGFNDSDIAKLMGPAKMTLEQGAATTIAACVTPDAQGGTYWTREKVGKEKAEARDEGVQERLWEVTRDLVKWG